MSPKLLLAFFLTCIITLQATSQTRYYLIAHRGGVVDSNRAENSLPALEAAFKRGYKMVEIDMRVTKDGVLIIHHDQNFKRYFNVDKKVTDMTWPEIQQLTSNTGSKVLLLEEALAYCSGKMQVMLDNKISGNDTVLFSKVISLLKKYRLNKEALMIGTDESTPWFTGKIKLSCTRKQLEENMRQPGYNPSDYYLFGGELTKEDIDWARKNKILAVGVINAWRYRRSQTPETDAAKDAERLKETGLTHFQLDSEFDKYFFD
ncbi:MAG: glycerophosphodiester phosphodiesterase [Agriterribacter sp.]